MIHFFIYTFFFCALLNAEQNNNPYAASNAILKEYIKLSESNKQYDQVKTSDDVVIVKHEADENDPDFLVFTAKVPLTIDYGKTEYELKRSTGAHIVRLYQERRGPFRFFDILWQKVVSRLFGSSRYKPWVLFDEYTTCAAVDGQCLECRTVITSEIYEQLKREHVAQKKQEASRFWP